MEKNNHNSNELQIDKVLSSQPELGPTVPDGGYGWVILAAAMFFQGLIPSLSVGLGVFVLFSRVENNASSDPSMPFLWDNNVVYVSLLFIATWTIAEPFSRYLSTTSTWPRLVSAAGTCLTCAGLLLMWIGINNGNSVAVFVTAGFLTGTGASIALSQADILIPQYFHLKLEPVTIILNAVNAFGFILTPIILGNNIVRLGMLQVITWYQAIILQGILLSIAFKKPKNLKMHRRKYKLIRGISDDEEDIFAKNITELQNPRRISGSSQNDNAKIEATIENTSTSLNKDLPKIPNGDINLATNTVTTNKNVQAENVEMKSINERSTHSNWENFDDETNDHVKGSKTQTNLHKTFAADFNNDLDRIDHFEDNYIDIPKPLFSETHINNNTSYSYDTPVEIEDPIVFMPVTKSPDESNWKRNLQVFKQPTFYKSLFFMITTKFSVFIFWTLFPSYLYVRIDYLKVHHTTAILGCIGIGSLLFATLTAWIKANANTRAIFLCFFCWIGSIGYLILPSATKETIVIFGAIGITLSVSALQILGIPLMKINLRGETNSTHTILSTLTGFSFILFLIVDMSYQNYFRLMALLQFLTGSLWFSNFMYKKIKKSFSRN